MLEIADSGADIHLTKQATTKMAPLIIPNEITARLPYGSAMGSSHIVILQLTGLSKQAIHIHIFPKMKTAPLVSLRVLCYDVCTITLDNQDISAHKNVQEIIKGTRDKKTGMWEVPLETHQSEYMKNNIMDQTTKP